MVRDGTDVPVPSDSGDLERKPLFPQLARANPAALAASLERARAGTTSSRLPPGFFGCAGPVYTESGGPVARAGATGSYEPPATDLSRAIPRTLLYDEGNQYWDYTLGRWATYSRGDGGVDGEVGFDVADSYFGQAQQSQQARNQASACRSGWAGDTPSSACQNQQQQSTNNPNNARPTPSLKPIPEEGPLLSTGRSMMSASSQPWLPIMQTEPNIQHSAYQDEQWQPPWSTPNHFSPNINTTTQQQQPNNLRSIPLQFPGGLCGPAATVPGQFSCHARANDMNVYANSGLTGAATQPPVPLQSIFQELDHELLKTRRENIPHNPS